MMNAIAIDYSTWLHTLPAWAQPVVAAFVPCFTVLAPLAIRHRVALYRKGEAFRRSKTKPAQLVGAMLVAGAMLYCRDHYPAAAQVLDWPDRAFPYYHRHAVAMWAGFGAAAYGASGLAALFAALFLRGGGGGHYAGGIAVGARPVVRSIWVEHSTRGE